MAELAAVIDAMTGAVPDAAPPQVEPIARGGDLELSFAQQRLWFLDQLAPGSAYNMSGMIRLDGALDTAALARALGGIVARHEVLRTTFASRGGRPVQVIAPSLRLALPIIDVGSRDQALGLAADAGRRPFDLARGPLFDAALFRLGPREHWLLLSMHHIVSDLWSVALFMEELAALYGGRELPPLRVQYADFAAWQRAWLAGGVLDQQLAYWRRQLAGASPRLALPTDLPRPPVLGSRGATRTFHLSGELQRSLEALGREQSATLFMTLLAAFQVLLHRYSRQDDIVVGAPVANRNRPELEGLIGFFVNTLALRTDLSGNPTFRELLGRVRQVAVGAYGHQDLPFEHLVEELQPKRDLSHTPVFQVMFGLEDAPPAPALAGLEHSLVNLDSGTAKVDLTLVVEHRPDGLAAALEYNTDLFEAATIERMSGHLQRLLAEVAADPGCRIDELPLLGDAERRRVLVEWSGATAPPPRSEPTSLPALIEAVVERRRDAIAVRDGEARVSYGELDARAGRLAGHLVELGARPGAIVAIAVERSIDLVVAQLAVLRSGAACLLIDPGAPADRVRAVLADAAVGLVLHHRRTAGAVRDLPGRHVAIDRLSDRPIDDPTGASDDRRRADAPAPDHLAYVVYPPGAPDAPGASDEPRGAMLTHASVIQLAGALGAELGMTAADRQAVISSPGSDTLLAELWPALAAGACLDLADDAARTDPARLWRWLVERRATIAWLPTRLAELVLDTAHPLDAGALRALCCTGDRLHRAPPPGAPFRLVHGHAAAETTGVAIAGDVAPGTPRPAIGRPLPGVTAYLLDDHLAPVPIGVPGELCVGGPGVAAGYLGRPELTARRFVANPFGPGRLHRTGDLARWLPDGTIDLVGRIDRPVEIRGFRVDVAAVEAALAEHPAVREAVVVARDDDPANEQLVAYVVGRHAPDAAALRAHLEARLPEYLLPSALVVLDALPLTASGDVDRAALQAPDRATDDGRRVAPRTPTELVLAQIFERLLGVSPVGAGDDFFLLGGHSLLALQLVAAIQDQLGATLPIAALFGARTVEALARAIDERAAATPSNFVALRREGDGIPVVLIHPSGGTVFCYLDLIARLAPGRPCHAIQARGLTAAPAVDSMAVMARDYVELVERQLGRGPCHLFGWSFGGVVALEMARLMTLDGRDVVSTTLLDSQVMTAMRPPEPGSPELIVWFAHDMGIAIPGDELAGLDEDQALARLAARVAAASIFPGHVGVPELARFLRVFEANLAAGRGHHGQPFPGDVTLIAATEAEEPLPPDHGFRPLVAGHLELRSMPGDHYSLLRPPQVDALARAFDELLAAAEARRIASRRG